MNKRNIENLPPSYLPFRFLHNDKSLQIYFCVKHQAKNYFLKMSKAQ